MSLFTISLALFLIMDPLGNLNSYLSLVNGLPASRQKFIVVREMSIALGVMLLFNFLGEHIFFFLSLSETTVRLSSGVILFLIGIKILFTSSDNPRANLPEGEPFIFPLAIPLIAGPGLLATIMLFAHLEPSLLEMFAAIVIAWIAAVLVFVFGKQIKRILGQNGLLACERLIGMILVLISIQRILEGIILFWRTYPNPA